MVPMNVKCKKCKIKHKWENEKWPGQLASPKDFLKWDKVFQNGPSKFVEDNIQKILLVTFLNVLSQIVFPNMPSCTNNYATFSVVILISSQLLQNWITRSIVYKTYY